MRTRVVAIGLVLFALVLAAQALSFLDLHRFLAHAAAHEHVTREAGVAIDRRNAALTALRPIVFLGTALAWCFWIHRAYRNAPALSGRPSEHTAGYAVGCHFIPFVNLVAPFNVMAEIWSGSTSERPLDRSASWLITVWWLMWIGGSLAAWGLTIAEMTPPRTLVDHLALARLLIASALAPLPGALLAFAVVRAVDRRQRAAAERCAEAGAG